MRMQFSAPQNQNGCIESSRSRRGLIERRARGDDEVRTFLALDAGQQRKPFRRDLGIGQDIFNGGDFGFGKEECVWLPVEKSFVEKFL